MLNFKQLLAQHLQPGQLLIEMKYQRRNGVQGTIQLGEEWTVNAGDVLFDEISNLFGENRIQYLYDAAEIRNGLIYKAPPPKFNYKRRDASNPRASA